MTGLENPTQDSPDAAELKQQVADLTRQSNYLFLGLVLVSLTLTGFLCVQWRRTVKDLDVVKPQLAQVLDLNAKDMPMIQNFMRDLAAYSTSHPDFVPILAKYGYKPTPAPAPGAPAGIPPASIGLPPAPPARK